MVSSRAARRLAAGLGVALLMGGCGGGAGTSGGNDRIRPTYNKDTGRLEKITFDRNADGKIDAWLFLDGTKVAMAELDENYDGKVDRWEYYGDAPAGAAVDQTTGPLALARNQIVRAEQSNRDDGRVDKWETYSGGILRELQLDTRGLGRPDRRIAYPADGGPGQLEVDRNGDGHFSAVTPQQ